MPHILWSLCHPWVDWPQVHFIVNKLPQKFHWALQILMVIQEYSKQHVFTKFTRPINNKKHLMKIKFYRYLSTNTAITSEELDWRDEYFNIYSALMWNIFIHNSVQCTRKNVPALRQCEWRHALTWNHLYLLLNLFYASLSIRTKYLMPKLRSLSIGVL